MEDLSPRSPSARALLFRPAARPAARALSAALPASPTCAVRAFMSGAWVPSNTKSTFSTPSPKVLVTLHTLEVKLRAGQGARGGVLRLALSNVVRSAQAACSRGAPRQGQTDGQAGGLAPHPASFVSRQPQTPPPRAAHKQAGFLAWGRSGTWR